MNSIDVEGVGEAEVASLQTLIQALQGKPGEREKVKGTKKKDAPKPLVVAMESLALAIGFVALVGLIRYFKTGEGRGNLAEINGNGDIHSMD